MLRYRERREQLRMRLRISQNGNLGIPRKFTVCLQPANADHLRKRDKYTYKFRPSKSREDPVLNCINEAIWKLCRDPEHMVLMCNHNIKVFPSTNAPLLWPQNPSNINKVKFYTFFQDLQEFPATVPVEILPQKGPLSFRRIQVRLGCKWIPIKEWLIQLADEPIHERTASSMDYYGRKRGLGAFRLMDLPTKLRLMVLQYVVAPEGEVYPLSQALWSNVVPNIAQRQSAHVTLGIGYHTGRNREIHLRRVRLPTTYPHEARKSVSAPDLAILCASKQLCLEALRVGWETSKRCFIDPKMFTAVADSRVGIMRYANVLGRIELSFTIQDWFKYFRIQANSNTLSRDTGSSLGSHLTNLRQECKLALRFRDPDDGDFGDPWQGSSTSCQTVMIDWIMTFAFEHISHIKQVDLTGYIKKPQREKWLKILSKQRKQEAHHFDHAAAFAAILSINDIQTARSCVCRKYCRRYNDDRWYSVDTYNRYGSPAGGKKCFKEGTTFDFEDGSGETDQ